MTLETDFIVVGSGIAGLRAAVELAGRGARVTVLTKDRREESNTEYAQGGVAVALSEEDEASLHEEDTLAAGAGLCDERAVEVLVGEVLERIKGHDDVGRRGGAGCELAAVVDPHLHRVSTGTRERLLADVHPHDVRRPGARQLDRRAQARDAAPHHDEIRFESHGYRNYTPRLDQVRTTRGSGWF